MRTHQLKTIAPFFSAVWGGEKTFEVRKNDRNFEVGDEVYLQEYDEFKSVYVGREVRVKIHYILKDYSVIEYGHIIFSFVKMQHIIKAKYYA